MKNYSLNSFVVADPDKCIGCRVCQIACSAAHADGDRALTVGSMKNPFQPRLHLMRHRYGYAPVQCRHCEGAPCANSCQVAAIIQKEGVILVDEDKCMGCKTCLIACPFGALEMAPVYRDGKAVEQNFYLDREGTVQAAGAEHAKHRYVATKCDLCRDSDRQPACVANCPQQALGLIDPGQHRAQRMSAAATGLAKMSTHRNR
ncbi:MULTISPECIES: 4Fe-4S dicluster domain-containing protein [Desulfosediminicola]|uniref:4Fe-4S dicluster domain-containing protein n=1 Tax=Desulfosediminicola TaxID=2886823 RepID=UPI0010AD8BFE|nr:4Fe-4S dicluster domain-containing protein [Desulfosediminicola ganghwensis]